MDNRYLIDYDGVSMSYRLHGLEQSEKGIIATSQNGFPTREKAAKYLEGMKKGLIGWNFIAESGSKV